MTAALAAVGWWLALSLAVALLMAFAVAYWQARDLRAAKHRNSELAAALRLANNTADDLKAENTVIRRENEELRDTLNRALHRAFDTPT